MNQRIGKILFGGLLCIGLLGTLRGGEAAGRAQLAALQTPQQCREALDEPEKPTVVRRHAFRKLLYNPATADEAIRRGLDDPDAGIRALAAFELFAQDGAAALPRLRPLLADPSAEVGSVLVEVARTLPDRDAGLALLQELRDATSSPEVKRRVSQTVGFKFYRENRPFSQNPVHDHEITLVQTLPLPLDGWRFKTDPENLGHLLQHTYYQQVINENDWSSIAVGEAWETQGFPGYDGIAWYRLRFTLPERLPGEAAELCFGAVDECAWIWLNGIYVGQHDEGPRGWQTPFRLEVTDELKWGAENLLVVRVEDTELAGGIWKPVTLEVLK